jgi:dipeptidase D
VVTSTDIPHGPLELLITVDEERGLNGAKAIAVGPLRAKYLLNLDSEEEGELTIGCAGGEDTIASRQFGPGAPRPGREQYKVELGRLQGGHSGIDINKGRGNAIRLLALVLHALKTQFDFELASFTGGCHRNVIPSQAEAVLYLDPAEEAAFTTALAAQEVYLETALGKSDPIMALHLERLPVSGPPAQVVLAPDAEALVNLLLKAPNGVEILNAEIPGDVETSSNLGAVSTANGAVEIGFLVRGSDVVSRDELTARIRSECSLAGFRWSSTGSYPGWKPVRGTSLEELVAGIYQRDFSKTMKVKTIHAGLECGILGGMYPGLEMASIGPDMGAVHTPKEWVSISSVKRFWQLLLVVLRELGKKPQQAGPGGEEGPLARSL